MAHDLASKLTAYRKATGARKKEAANELSSLIFQFWEHRHSLADGLRPFDNYDAVLGALESLDPTNEHDRYFNYERPLASGLKNMEQQKHWLNLARTFDRGARSIITMCLSAAAQAAGKPPEVWLKVAGALASNDDFDMPVIFRIVFSDKDLVDDEVDLNAPERKRLERISAQLDAMLQSSREFKSHLDQRLAAVKEKRLVRKSSLKSAIKHRKKR